MSGHVILKGAALVLSAERAEGAPEAIYGAECMACTAESGLVDNDPKPVAVWALEHAGRHGLSHGQFLVTTHKHWRVDPVLATVRPGGGVVPAVPVGEDRPLRSGAHAPPRGRGVVRRLLRLLVARGGRLLALLVLAVLVRAAALFGVTAARQRRRAAH